MADKMKDENYTVVGVPIPVDLHLDFKIHCVKNKVSMREELEKIIIQGIKESIQSIKEVSVE